MLPYEGYFNVMCVDGGTTYHYGQRLEMYTREEFEEIAKYIGFTVIGSTSMEIKNSLTPYTLVLKK